MNKPVEQEAPRMRTISNCIKSIKEADPESDFTEYALRQMATQGLIPSTMVGTKFLINYDILLAYLALGGEATGSDSSND